MDININGIDREQCQQETIVIGVKVEYYVNHNSAARADANRAELRARAGAGCYTTVHFDRQSVHGWSNLDSAIALVLRCHEFGREAYREDLVKFLGIKERR